MATQWGNGARRPRPAEHSSALPFGPKSTSPATSKKKRLPAPANHTTKNPGKGAPGAMGGGGQQSGGLGEWACGLEFAHRAAALITAWPPAALPAASCRLVCHLPLEFGAFLDSRTQLARERPGEMTVLLAIHHSYLPFHSSPRDQQRDPRRPKECHASLV
jgi:hypothetical protein